MRLNVGSAVITEKFLTVVRRQRDEPYRGGPGAPPKSCKSFIIAETPAVKFVTILSRFMFQTGANQGGAGRIKKCGFEVKFGSPGGTRRGGAH